MPTTLSRTRSKFLGVPGVSAAFVHDGTRKVPPKLRVRFNCLKMLGCLISALHFFWSCLLAFNVMFLLITLSYDLHLAVATVVPAKLLSSLTDILDAQIDDKQRIMACLPMR